jgi:hypothetical protein
VDAVENQREIHFITAAAVTHITSKIMFFNKAA